jgi:pSer/pThr/pTyr-binding forkhead associated (FHA) protein
LVWTGKKTAPYGLEVILLNQPELRVGRSKKECQIVLNYPSVEKNHALITISAEGQVKIANRSAKSGTWLNYAPVSPQGANLQPGDLVHFGKVAFRFEIN